jgi:hypothetical protein
MTVPIAHSKKFTLSILAIVVIGIGGLVAYKHTHHTFKLSKGTEAEIKQSREAMPTPYGKLREGVITPTSLNIKANDYANKEVNVIGYMFKAGNRYVLIDTGVNKPRNVFVKPASTAVDLQPYVLNSTPNHKVDTSKSKPIIVTGTFVFQQDPRNKSATWYVSATAVKYY